MQPRPTLQLLVDYNLDVLRESAALIRRLQDFDVEIYADQIGPHLRHVMDHYVALLEGLPQGVIDYEARRRDQRTQSDPAYALQQLADLMGRLAALAEALPAVSPTATPLAVVIAGGRDGAELSASQSSLLRELQFLGLHAVHHYAVIAPRLKALGIELSEDFGKAPGTIRHERESRRQAGDTGPT